MAALRPAAPRAEALMATIEEALEQLRPAAVLVAGDCEATVAGGLAASTMGIPVARVGAGLRSGDWGLRDEVARVVLDSLADRLYTDGPDATLALAAQGVPSSRIAETGSTLADSVLRWRERAAARTVWRRFGLVPRQYFLATLHRDENLARADACVAGLTALARRERVLLVLHPRTRAALEPSGHLEALRDAGVLVSDPLDYVDFLSLEIGAGAIVTDSAGVQEESTVLDVPCYTLRITTERSLTLTHGTNVLLGDDPGELADLRLDARREASAPIRHWDGRAGQRIAEHLTAKSEE